MNIITEPTFEFSSEEINSFRTVRQCIEQYCDFFKRGNGCKDCPSSEDCLAEMIDFIEETFEINY